MYVMDPMAENRTEEKVHIYYYQQARHRCGMDSTVESRVQ